MAGYRKLSRTGSQRKAILRNQVSNLLWYGKIKTTEARAKEVRKIADKYVQLAVNEYDKSITVEKSINNEKGQTIPTEFVNDMPSKLNARRVMLSYLYEMKEPKLDDESMSEYKERVKEINHPLVEKLFREIGPKYRTRNEEKESQGGYTRILKLGKRKGDGAEEVLIELV